MSRYARFLIVYVAFSGFGVGWCLACLALGHDVTENAICAAVNALWLILGVRLLGAEIRRET